MTLMEHLFAMEMLGMFDEDEQEELEELLDGYIDIEDDEEY